MSVASRKSSVAVPPFCTVIAVKVGSLIVPPTHGSTTVTVKVSKSAAPARNSVAPLAVVWPAEVTVRVLWKVTVNGDPSALVLSFDCIVTMALFVESMVMKVASRPVHVYTLVVVYKHDGTSV